MSEIGARVIVRPEFADLFIQPFRRWIKEGRPATCKEGRPIGDRGVLIQFDCRSKPKRPHDYQLRVKACNLEVLPK